ncbi:hypothetical protein BV898_13606 [Hypsibius exemplaris]|uniref:RING-type domain-containing protein n=1 Tax=Hypsibius exemplaris TaxID=2072580 RepID=A0A1W0WAD3_HYPEX|nr:hypothetical protein BV898_13606 [Hypsibius exemplaris]
MADEVTEGVLLCMLNNEEPRRIVVQLLGTRKIDTATGTALSLRLNDGQYSFYRGITEPGSFLQEQLEDDEFPDDSIVGIDDFECTTEIINNKEQRVLLIHDMHLLHSGFYMDKLAGTPRAIEFIRIPAIHFSLFTQNQYVVLNDIRQYSGAIVQPEPRDALRDDSARLFRLVGEISQIKQAQGRIRSWLKTMDADEDSSPEYECSVSVPYNLIVCFGVTHHKERVDLARTLSGITSIELSVNQDEHLYSIIGTSKEAVRRARDLINLEIDEETVAIPAQFWSHFTANQSAILKAIRAEFKVTVTPENSDGVSNPLRVRGLDVHLRAAVERIKEELESVRSQGGKTVRLKATEKPKAPPPETYCATVRCPVTLINRLGEVRHKANLETVAAMPGISPIEETSSQYERTYIIKGMNAAAVSKARDVLHLEMVQQQVSIPLEHWQHFLANNSAILEKIRDEYNVTVKPGTPDVIGRTLRVEGLNVDVRLAIVEIRGELYHSIQAEAVRLQQQLEMKRLEAARQEKLLLNAAVSGPANVDRSPAEELISLEWDENDYGHSMTVEVPVWLIRHIGYAAHHANLQMARQQPGMVSIAVTDCSQTVTLYLLNGTTLTALEKARDIMLLEPAQKTASIPARYYSVSAHGQNFVDRIQTASNVILLQQYEGRDETTWSVEGPLGNVLSAMKLIHEEVQRLESASQTPVATRPLLATGVNNSAETANPTVIAERAPGEGPAIGVDADCIICSAAPATTAFIPCGHMNFCNACATVAFAMKKECPCCRGMSSLVVRIYTPTSL